MGLDYSSDLPLVSVIIPCYNSELYIKECVESVLDQCYENIEIIVVDDGSTDTSLEVLQSIEGVFVLSQKNLGACSARNLGLKVSKGKYIKFLDSDDFLEPESITKQVFLAEKSDSNTIVYGDYYIKNGSSKKYKSTFLEEGCQVATLFIKDIYTTTPLHEREKLNKVGGFDERFKNGQEWNLHIRLAAKGYIFKHHPDPVFNYRVHNSEERISNKRSKDSRRIMYEIEKTKMTLEKLTENVRGLVQEAVSFRYWWIARELFRSGNYKESFDLLSIAKSMTLEYKKYWPLYYKVVYGLFGFRFGEFFLKAIYSIRSFL